MRLGILIAARQLYFLGRNLYHLATQPYLTLKQIIDKGDKSQTFLIVVTAMIPTWGYVAARVVYDLAKYGRILWLTGNLFQIALVIQIATMGYLVFWTVKVLKGRNQ